jgi:hypothetical protein
LGRVPALRFPPTPAEVAALAVVVFAPDGFEVTVAPVALGAVVGEPVLANAEAFGAGPLPAPGAAPPRPPKAPRGVDAGKNMYSMWLMPRAIRWLRIQRACTTFGGGW